MLKCATWLVALSVLMAANAFAQPEPSELEWENLDAGTIYGPIETSPSCVARAHARIDCFALSSANHGLMRREWNGIVWTPWENVGGDVRGRPECVSWGPARVDCFVRGVDNSLRHAWWEGEGAGSGDLSVGTARLQTDALFFRGWDDLGGSFNSEIDCVSWDFARLDCFVRGTDNALWHRWWDGAQWRGWDSLGGQIAGRPECVSWSAFRIDCFALTPQRRMAHRAWNVTSWLAWDDLGSGFESGDISCVSYAVNRIDCFARGVGGRLMSRSWNGSQWLGEELGRAIKDPECVSWGVGRIDCLAPEVNGSSLYHRAWDLRWRDWEGLGTTASYQGAMSCTSWGQGRIDCFATSAYGRLRHKWWDGQRWWPSEANSRLTPEPAPQSAPPPPSPTPSPRQAPTRPPRFR